MEEKKRLEDYSQTKPDQLFLFEITNSEEQKYSHTIELYDFMPKYYWGAVSRVNDQFLPRLEREFECKGSKFKVKIDPAKIEGKDGKVRDYYPSQREEIVEDALRKLVCEGRGTFLDDQAGVIFTIYELQKELATIGHKYSYDQIKEALYICVGTTIELVTEGGTGIFKSHIFENLGLQTLDEWKGNGKKTKCFVRFNALVTSSIKNKTFRQTNYDKYMSYRGFIARQLHKRMSHFYKQAGLMNPYHILLSTIIRDFGITQYKKLSNNLREVIHALEEMKQKEVILNYSTEKIIDTKDRQKLLDVKITIISDPKFTAEVIRANKKQKELLPNNY